MTPCKCKKHKCAAETNNKNGICSWCIDDRHPITGNKKIFKSFLPGDINISLGNTSK